MSHKMTWYMLAHMPYFAGPVPYRGEYPTLIYPCRRAYRKVMMQQQGL